MTDALDLGLSLARVSKAATDAPTLDFHVGRIISWNSTTATNKVEVLGQILFDLPVLTSAGSVGLENDVLVGVLKVRTQYFILGRIVDLNTGLINPQFPIVLYPQFRPLGAAGLVLYWYVDNTSVGAQWEGRTTISFPYIEVDGIWGCNPSPGNLSTYSLKVGGTTVGTWSETGVVVNRHGPFDVRSFIGQNWVSVQVEFTSYAGGVATIPFQVLGCYFRDTL